MRGRDMTGQHDLSAAPDTADGNAVCFGCPLAAQSGRAGKRPHIRVDRADLSQIDWNHPQHVRRNSSRYQARTGVERAIKCLKVDLKGERLAHRDSVRVQAHMDRKLLTFHLLLAQAATE
jgi:hypothetical protein